MCHMSVCSIVSKAGFSRPVLLSDDAELQPFHELNGIVQKLRIFRCPACEKLIVKENGELLYPAPLGVDPCEDMPESIRGIFVEAQRITHLSPRSACALLRVCLERLCDAIAEMKHLDGYRRDAWLWKKIEALELRPEIKAIFDMVKDVGNSSAHGDNKASEIDFTSRDSVEVALKTADVINALVRFLITPMTYPEKMRAYFQSKA